MAKQIQLTEKQWSKLEDAKREAEDRVMILVSECRYRNDGLDQDLKDQLEAYWVFNEGYLVNVEEDFTIIDAENIWGRCRKVGENWMCRFPFIHNIEINIRLLEDNVDTEYLINTVAHEYLHSIANNCCEGSCGHKGLWKYLASVYNEINPDKLPIRRTKGIPNIRKTEAKYIVECPRCHTQWKFLRMTETVKHPEYYHCKKCHENLVRIK